MKQIWIILFSLGGSAFGALPPLAQSLAELKALLNSPELSQYLSYAESIEDIRKTEHGYQLRTNTSTLDITVDYQPAARPGPVPFSLQFQLQGETP